MSTANIETISQTAPAPRRERRNRAASGFWILLGLLRPHYWLMALTIGSGVLNQGAAIASAAVGALQVGAAATGATPADLTPGLWLLAGLVLLRALMAWAEMWWAHDLAFRILAEIRFYLYNALDRLAPGYLLERRSGDLGAAAMGDVEILEWFYAHTVGAAVVATVVPLGCLLALTLINPLLASLLLPFVLLVASVPFWLSKWAARQGDRLRSRVGELNSEVVDGVQGLRELVMFGRGATQLGRLRGHSRLLVDVQLAHGRRSGLENSATNALVGLGMLVVLAAAASLVAAGQLSGALFPVSVILAGSIFAPIVAVTNIGRNLGVLLAAADRVFTVLQEPAPVEDRATTMPPGPIEPRICFNGVGFRYKSAAADALCDVSFEMAPGETIALVGHSGAGKSTAAHLLLRFWDVRDGAISIGGHDIRKFPLAALRDLLTLVPQDVYLFNTTIAENIRLGKPGASDAEVEEAAREALIHDFIAALPNGYAMKVGERGAQLSGGQRQRIAIARALLKDAPVLVLDEAVSNLDTENERLIGAALGRLRAGRTTLVIAHRLSTILSADRLVVLEGGRVAEIGTHGELVARNGVYARLIASQREGLLLD